MQPQQKQSMNIELEDIEIMSKRKGKIIFTRNGVQPAVTKTEEDAVAEDVTQSFKQDQKLLNSLLKNCKGEDKDMKTSVRQLKDMQNESQIVQTRFNMVFDILQELEGVDARAIEQLFYYKVNGLQEFEQEAKEVTRIHKFAQLEGTGATAKMQIQQDTVRRKQLLSKIK